MHPRFRWCFTLLAAMLLGLGLGACGDAGGSSNNNQAGGAGGPVEEPGAPPPTSNGNGGAGGPEEPDGGTPEPDIASSPTVATACVPILRADEEAATALDDFARRPEQEQTPEVRDEVAALLEEARAQVEDYLEGLPPGPVLDASARLLTEQTAVRDALIAGTPVSRDGLGDARAALEDACDAV